ncbi:MAG TPA: PAS domain S-box protein, partial [bacterium]|nr:PAS domain S-box protein [bacterium]
MSSLLSTSNFRIPLTGRATWLRFVVALAAVGLGLGAKLVLENFWPDQFSPFTVFYIAVMISAWYGGLVPGLLTMVAGALVAIYDFPVQGSFQIQRSGDVMRLLLFLFNASMICILIENLHRALIRHNSTARELIGSQKRVRSILESVQGCFFSLDQDGNFIHINKDCDKYVDGDYRRFVGKPLWEAFPGWKGSTFEAQLDEAQRLKQVVEFEFHDERSGHWYEVHISPAAEGGISVHFYDIGPRKRAELELVESEERFRRIADQAPVMIWTTDAAGVRNYVNQPWLNFRGRTLEEELGEGWEEGIHPTDLAPALKIFQEAFAQRRSFRKEYRWRRFDGVYRWMVSTGAPRFDAEGKFIGYVGSALDITETRQTLKEREAFLLRHNEVLVNLAKKPKFPDFEGRIREVAQAAAGGLDVSRSSVWFFTPDRTKLRCLDLFVRDSGEHRKEADLEVERYPAYFDSLDRFRTIAAENAAQDPRTREFGEVYLKPAGIVSMLDAPIRHHGRTIGVLCSEGTGEARQWTLEEQTFAASLSDMIALAVEERDRSLAEEALKQSERRLRRLIESGVIGVIYGDARTDCINEANDVFLKMVGYSREELKAGKLHWPSMTPPEYLEQDKQKWQECVEKGWCETYEKEYFRKDGSRVPIILGISALDEARTQWACFVLDISDRKLRERRQITEYAITQILSGDPLLSAAIPKILQAICESLDWELGAYWEIPDGKQLQCSEVWARDPGKFSAFLQATLEAKSGSPGGLPERAWMSGRSIWLEELGVEDFPRKAEALREGLVSAVVFPVHFGEELLGVFEFYGIKRQPAEDRLLEMFEVVGSEIGQFIERKRAEEDLRLSQQHLNLALQAARMGY